jgi:hypothetical protein
VGYEHYRQTLSKNVDMKNSEDNNYGIRFKSKTEAIEQLCLKVFGATPVYGSSLEDLKTKESQSCPECDALASHGANDGPCETHKL